MASPLQSDSKFLVTFVAKPLVLLGYAKTVEELDAPLNLRNAIVAFKKDYNQKCPDKALPAGEEVDGPLVAALNECVNMRVAKTALTVALVGAGGSILLGIGAYYLGKRSSHSQAELTMGSAPSCGCWGSKSNSELAVGSYDSKIYLPGYG